MRREVALTSPMRNWTLVALLALVASSGALAKDAAVDAVWVRGSGATATGGTTRVELRTGPNSTGAPAVGVIEQFVDGTGAQWRSSSWIAADVASRLAQRPLVKTEFIVKVGGHIDGPSAGLLMTAAMTALLTGAPIKADVTMTGAVNPDGTSGPVGGIPQKIRGAAAAGKKVFGYPAGGRMSVDLSTGKVIDVEALAQSVGMQAIEIFHAREAYAVLTGKTLPEVKALEARAFEPTPAQMAFMRERVDRVRADVSASLARVKGAMGALSPEAQRDVANLVGGAEEARRKAEAFEREGAFESAHDAWLQVLVTTRMAERAQQALALLRVLDFDGLEKLARDKMKVLDDATDMNVKARTVQATVTAVDLLRGSVVLGAVADGARAQLATGLAALESARKTGEKAAYIAAAQGLTGPIALASVAEILPLLLEGIAADPEEASTPLTSLDAFNALASGGASTAAAVLASVDALVVEGDARAAGVSVERMREVARQKRIEYRTAERGVAMASGGSHPLIKMAGAAQARVDAASLVMRYYSLEMGNGDRAGNPRALANSLETSRNEVLRTCALTKQKLGALPVSVKRSFRSAEAERGGTDDDKLGALTSYWHASLGCATATALATKSAR